jgi:hypothetical protein
MVDIQTISIAIASASVVAGVFYYSFQIRNETKARKTDLILRLFSHVNNREFLEATQRFAQSEFTDWATYAKKYGTADFNQIGGTFEVLGLLLRNKLIEISLVDDLVNQDALQLMEKMKPAIEEVRKLGNKHVGVAFEYLYNEMKKREQQQASKKA